MPLLASIPSPSSPILVDFGPFHVRWYGLLLAAGVAAGFLVTRREFGRRGLDPEQVATLAVWVVPLGLIGARLYHVVTDWSRFSNHLERIPAIWQGGLGIYGAILGGALGAAIVSRQLKLNVFAALDCIAPGCALAQAMGRFGNYFNQELFGRPTSLPWGLKIDLANRPAGYEHYSTFQPTFLYESIWNLVVFAILTLVARRIWRNLPAGALLALYLALYSFGRFFVEGLRIDPAHHLGPLRLNQVVAAIVFAIATVVFLALRRRGGPPRLTTAQELISE